MVAERTVAMTAPAIIETAVPGRVAANRVLILVLHEKKSDDEVYSNRGRPGTGPDTIVLHRTTCARDDQVARPKLVLASSRRGALPSGGLLPRPPIRFSYSGLMLRAPTDRLSPAWPHEPDQCLAEQTN